MSVNPIPARYSSITPYLICRGAAAAIDFYQRAFGAIEVLRLGEPDGPIGHAEITIGNSNVMLADEFPQMGALSPQSIGGTAVSLLLYVEDCDAVFHKAVAEGASIERPLQDQFYGDRSGMLIDPFGHRWSISTHIEDVTPDEIARRVANMKG